MRPRRKNLAAACRRNALCSDNVRKAIGTVQGAGPEQEHFEASVWPHRVRAYLVLFALALTVPSLALTVFALDRMASIEEAQLERRVVEAARDLAADIDRELDRAIVTLETLATSAELARGDFRAFHRPSLL